MVRAGVVASFVAILLLEEVESLAGELDSRGLTTRARQAMALTASLTELLEASLAPVAPLEAAAAVAV
jgi:hypothetical protein